MRREIFRSDSRDALALLRRVPVVHLATTTPEGEPVLRALDAAVLEDGVYFHGSRSGEKVRCLGRPAVVQAEELAAHLPSWMIHPSHACPATTLYRSVQVHGTLREEADVSKKARVLETLMRRWQPEGRYDPIDASDPHYAGALQALLVIAVTFERVDGKFKLGQNRRPAEIAAILAGLWERGRQGDDAAIEAIRGANPGVPDPPFLAAGDFRMVARVPDEDVPAVEDLLHGEYWWSGQPRALIGPAHRNASAWVGARAPDGRLVASARAVSDGKTAWIYDVVVAPALRGRGLGTRLFALLLDHPAVRRARFVLLRTRDAQGVYAKFGFEAQRTRPEVTEMMLEQPKPENQEKP
jgi:nitroimidazol reductase NimA-like FMN-containing flavoprotein (pyridoxamine 5'-phosphate oxidase superfamily)/ribosomal protein S18 acetylase RimI-like enzyme